jgi:CRISPR/Cas system-associated protein Cas5 (RAMP superfamily)
MDKKVELSEEHLVLLEEAEELGVDTFGYFAPDANLDSLREAIARETERLAKQAAAQQRLERAASEAEAEEELATEGAFDEVMGQTRGVLIRVTEWTEWLPVTKSEHLSALTLANGVTGFEAGENERLLTVDTVGTNRVKTVEVDEEGMLVYMLYAFKATLAQNVRTTLVTALIDAQGSNAEGETQQPSRIITPEDGAGPNRSQRRHPGA